MPEITCQTHAMSVDLYQGDETYSWAPPSDLEYARTLAQAFNAGQSGLSEITNHLQLCGYQFDEFPGSLGIFKPGWPGCIWLEFTRL